MIEEAAHNLHNADIVLLPIILIGHFHLVVLDKDKQEYWYYSSCQNLQYDDDTFDMVI